MYLVDTSVWIDFIQGHENSATTFLDFLLKSPSIIGLNDHIYMEILQGAKSQTGFDKLRDYFSTQQFYGFANTKESYAAAAQLFFNCRRQGITVRSAVDCLIARCAFENELTLLHNDRDFCNMQPAIPKLQQKHFLND